MATLFTDTVTLERIVCATCGVPFAMPSEFLNYRRSNAGNVYCPSGHTNCWRESDADKVRKELVAERARTDQLKATVEDQRRQRMKAEADLVKEKRLAARTANRISKGVCPCCNRTFTDLHRHMATKHPEHGKE